MEIKVKKLHPDAVLPKSSLPTDAGFDVVAIDDGEINDTYIQYKTGIALEVSPGFHVEIFPRSSISKKELVLANSVGILDETYRDELLCRFKIITRPNSDSPTNVYSKGDRIAQLIIRKTIRADFKWVENLSITERKGGFGWTGR